MKRFLIVFGAVVGLSTSAFALEQAKVEAEVSKTAVETAPEVKKKKITDRRDPDYVRCRREPIIGSLARKRRICMTNRKWAEMAREGNRQSRDLVEGAMSNAGNSNP